MTKALLNFSVKGETEVTKVGIWIKPNEDNSKPIYFKTHYWKVGAHHWKPGYDSDIITGIMLNPLNNVYICGEAFSTKQAWMEGALETSEKVIKLIKNEKNKK